MVGRTVDLGVDKAPAQPGETTFSVQGLTVVDATGVTHVDDVSFDVARGEILVVAGVQGNGQTEITECILGLTRPVRGSIRLDGTELVGRDVGQVLRAGVGFVPEDRSVDGIVGDFSVAENLVLDRFGDKAFGGRFSMDLKAIRANADHRIDEFDIRTQGPEQPGRPAQRRQPAEGRDGARAVAPAEAVRREPAHPRRRRRVDRVPAQADRGRARPRHPGDHRVHRARRGARARRPDRRDVPRPHRRHRPRRHRPRRPRPDDGRRAAGRGGEAGARRTTPRSAAPTCPRAQDAGSTTTTQATKELS